jgi:hypothetical protein
MASFQRVGEKWKVQVFKNGKRAGKTFATKAEATIWVAQTDKEKAP